MSKHKRAPADFLKQLQDGSSEAFLRIFSDVEGDEQQTIEDSGTSDNDDADDQPDRCLIKRQAS